MQLAERALNEFSRVGRRDLIVSVPQEPIWRLLNLIRGTYPRRLGNTQGHIRHSSRSGIIRLLESKIDVIEVHTPIPWTFAQCRIR
jgi:hypothetical protein